MRSIVQGQGRNAKSVVVGDITNILAASTVDHNKLLIGSHLAEELFSSLSGSQIGVHPRATKAAEALADQKQQADDKETGHARGNFLSQIRN